MGATEITLGQQLLVILPEIGLALLAIIIIGLDVGIPGMMRPLGEGRKQLTAIVCGVWLGLLAAITLLLPPGSEMIPQGLYWGGMIRYDVLAQIFKFIVLAAAAITSLMSYGVKGIGRKPEFYLVLVVSTLGMTLMAGAADLIMVFLALETTSIPLYILAGFKRDDDRSSESAMKYFLFGSFASAIMLYGLSLLFGFTGHTNLYDLAEYLGSSAFANNPIPVLGAMVLVIVGFGFKISAVPFHFWTPDVYEGAPTPVTAFLSVASKAASFALLLRFFVAVFPSTLVIGGQDMQTFWVQLLAVSAVISMTVGNVVALAQKNIKRLLAYSSIAHAGYTLIGVAAIQATTLNGQTQAVASVAFYMFIYMFTNLLAFAVVIIFSEATGSENISDLAGLSRRNPWLALMMTIALLSLAGIPPTAGFVGKFFLFNAAVGANLTGLAIIGVLNAIVALYYYLVVIKVMYVNRSEDDNKPILVSRPYVWVLGITGIALILLGTVAVQPVFEWAMRSASSLFPG